MGENKSPPFLYNFMFTLSNPIQLENPFKKAKMIYEAYPEYPHQRHELNIESMMRVIKISALEGGIEPKFEPMIPLKFLKSIMSDEDILTGSIAVDIFFNLEREIKDIDIITTNQKKWGELIKTSYPEEPDNYRGSTYRKHRMGIFKKSIDYKIDVFTYPCNWIVWSGIKIHNPISILEIKSKAYKNSSYKSNSDVQKHYYDIYRIYNRIK